MQNDLKIALEVLRNGGLILYPTDTIWGIGCDATNPDAVDRIYKLKQREDSKSMLTLIENPNMLNIYLVAVPEIAWDLIEVADKPLTIIYPKAKNLAPNLVAADGSIGIRVVKHTFCERLIQAFRKPIVSTSANISGQAFPKSFGDIAPEIKAGVDFVVPQTYEESTSPMPSGIIQLGLGGEVKVIRE
ncbi:MAG: L-threonylcarbamoyladenylate synthase [Bacteroidales bacterium]|nr:L-threonylcarbamoyladenylate synthase [Bacteroidales bacterium]MDY0253322.1 L-threonylcarbamoyladenylate synthase [Tenuifilaceae bacterium]